MDEKGEELNAAANSVCLGGHCASTKYSCEIKQTLGERTKWFMNLNRDESDCVRHMRNPVDIL